MPEHPQMKRCRFCWNLTGIRCVVVDAHCHDVKNLTLGSFDRRRRLAAERIHLLSLPLVHNHASPLGGSLSRVEATPLADVASIVARARAAQPAWGALPVGERIATLKRMKDRVLDAGERIAASVHKEIGKPEAEAWSSEVLGTADVVDYWCDEIEEHLADRPIDDVAKDISAAWTKSHAP